VPCGEIDVVASDHLLGTSDRLDGGRDEAAAVGDRCGVGVEEADEGVDLLGFPCLLEVRSDASVLGCRRCRNL
jgi:hypothetical protein